MAAASDREELGRTQAAPEFVGGGAAATGDPTAPPELMQRRILELLLQRGRGFGEPGPRYRVEGLLGVGGGGRVFAAMDHDLGRPVAMKVLGDAADDNARHFIDEASITASLSHPNVLPVYELGLTADGGIYYTMKRIEGRAFAAVLDGSAPALAANELLRVFIGVAQALAYAHHRGIVHQDIKPENIMLGDFGEVLVVDWGSAARLDPGAAPRIYGTPLYMSPEQARVESVDARSDIYGLGATMFHALVGRLPAWSDVPERFWEKKKKGEIDPLTTDERRRVPAALLAIALKAMAPQPAERYQRVDELLRDLDSYQGGLAVSAYAEPLLARLRRWHRRHARPFWLAVAVTSVIVTLGAALYGERLKELAEWGPAIFSEDFADDSWKERWAVYDGGFERRGGQVVSTGSDESLLLCRQAFSTPIAIEYDGEILPGSKPCDISLAWCREPDPRDPEHRDWGLVGEYLMQVGAMDAMSCEIFGEGRTLGFSYFKPEAGRRYHIRDEIVDDRITMFIDGVEVCSYRAAIPFDHGCIGLRGYYPDKAFANVRVFARGVPERLPATALGDLLARKQRYDEAAKEYQRVADAHRGKPIAEEATYRVGLCAFWQKHYEDAETAWKPIVAGRFGERIGLHRLDRLADEKDPSLLAQLERLHRGASAETRHRIAEQWCQYAVAAAKGIDADYAQPESVRAPLVVYLDVRDRLFPDEQITDRPAARLMVCLGRLREIVRRFPRLTYECAQACFGLGRPDWVLSDYPQQRSWRQVALFDCARFDELGEVPGFDSWALIKQMRFAEADQRYGSNPDVLSRSLLAQGRLDEAVAAAPGDHWVATHALMMSGRAGEARPADRDQQLDVAMALGDGERALALCPIEDGKHRWVRSLLGLQAWIHGDRAGAERWFTDPPWPEGYSYWQYHQFLVPFLHGLDGDRGELERSCRAAIADDRYFDEQHSWYCARALLGEIEEREFLAQPSRLHAEADWRRCQGMRAEREGRREDALAAYRAYLDLPLWRRSDAVDPVWDGLARWRVERLGSAKP
jgi:hypothetical protein